MKNKIELVQSKVDALKVSMLRLIKKQLSGLESLESLQKKAEYLSRSAKIFKKRSKLLRRASFFKLFKVTLMLITFCTGVVALAVAALVSSLGLVSHAKALVLVASAIALTAVIISALEIASRLGDVVPVKNPFHFFNRKKSGEDRVYQHLNSNQEKH